MGYLYFFYNQGYIAKQNKSDNVALPAFARRRPLLQQSIDISYPQGPRQ